MISRQTVVPWARFPRTRCMNLINFVLPSEIFTLLACLYKQHLDKKSFSTLSNLSSSLRFLNTPSFEISFGKHLVSFLQSFFRWPPLIIPRKKKKVYSYPVSSNLPILFVLSIILHVKDSSWSTVDGLFVHLSRIWKRMRITFTILFLIITLRERVHQYFPAQYWERGWKGHGSDGKKFVLNKSSV